MSGQRDAFSKTAGVVWGLVLVAIAAAILAGLGAAYRGQASWAVAAGVLLSVDVVLTILLLAASGQHDRVRMGLWGVFQFDAFALLMLGCGWALAGGQPALGAALAVAFAAVATLGYVYRRPVLGAFLDPRANRLGLLIGLVPILGAGGPAEGLVLARVLGPGSSVIAAVFAVVALYLALFAQAMIFRITDPPRAPRPGRF